MLRVREIHPDGTIAETFGTWVLLDTLIGAPEMDPRITGVPSLRDELEASLRELPMISLVVPTGLDMDERAASIEWVDPSGVGDPEVQAGCGARIVGGTSYVYEKNSVRLSFRRDYGPSKLDLEIYGADATGVEAADEHDMLTLRSGNHDTVFYLGAQGQHLRNFWMDETQLDMGHVAPHGRFVHALREGQYWGVYHVRERFNAAFMAEYHGGEEEDYEAINAGNAFDGSGAAWATVVASVGDYAELSRWVDTRNFLDYMVLNFYAANAWDWYDWHNWISAGPTEPDRGGFRFHSSDSDICLYYDWTVNILSNPGPSQVFGSLLAVGDPQFKVDLADAIYRNLRPGGPLSAQQAGDRYARLAAQAESAMVVESARWGFGWWDRDEEWVTERDRLLSDFFPQRTGELWRQMREAGWYPVEAPVVSVEPGVLVAGGVVNVSVPDGVELWVSVDGEDPRASDGSPRANTPGPAARQSIEVQHSVLLKARARQGGVWGPIVEGLYEIDEDPVLLLNEWNAVEPERTLGTEAGGEAGSDAALGVIAGNGGDWFELLVMQDELDLRGWTFRMVDRNGEAGTLRFTDAPLLAGLRAGTLITVSEDLPEDPSLDPDAGDWRFNLRAGVDGSGVYVSAAPFEVTHREWQLTAHDAEGWVRIGPAGEGISPERGVGGDEVGLLAGQPDAGVRRQDNSYGAGVFSTFGAANVWEGGAQDLNRLRQDGAVFEPDSEPAEGDSGGSAPDPEPSDEEGSANTGCGCAHAAGGAAGWAWLLVGVWWLPRRWAGRDISGVVRR